MDSLNLNQVLKHIFDASCISSLIFLCAFLFGIYIVFRRNQILKKGVFVEGEIEDLIMENHEESSTFYPLVSFYSQLDQRVVVYKSNFGATFKAYKKKQKVSVVYLPKEPQHFILNENPSKLTELIFLLAAFFGFSISLYCFLNELG